MTEPEELPIDATIESQEAELVIRRVTRYHYADGTSSLETTESRRELDTPITFGVDAVTWKTSVSATMSE